MATHSQIIESLRRHAPYLQDAVHREIADGLTHDGLLEREGERLHASAAPNHHLRTLNAAAADPASAHLIKRVMAFARHRGIDLPLDRPIDVGELDRAMTGKGISVGDRINFKSWLFQHGLIPA